MHRCAPSAIAGNRSGSPLLSQGVRQVLPTGSRGQEDRAFSPGWESVTHHERILKRQIEDDYPILRAPHDPKISLVEQYEGPVDNIQVTNWKALHFLNKADKDRITTAIRGWIRYSDYSGAHSVRFNKMFELKKPDTGPERGLSLFAKINIEEFIVLGPYAGILHDDNQSLTYEQEIQKYGEMNIISYSFLTDNNERVVSAFASGNILSYMNTAKLPGCAKIPGKFNNVCDIAVGKNMTFYVTKKRISAGTELFIDYGKNYQFELHAKPAPQHRVLSPSQESMQRNELYIHKEFQRTLKRHAEDDYPILRDPHNPAISLVDKYEGPADQIQVTNWNKLYFLNAFEQERITAEIRDWIRASGSHAIRFNALFEWKESATAPHSEFALFAKKFLPAHTVLGPYAGLLHESQMAPTYVKEKRKYGAVNITNYTWLTNKEDRVISAFPSSNHLVYMNTAKLPGGVNIPGRINNVCDIAVGNYMIFYITTRPVQPGAELFINYGNNYGYESYIKNIKQESDG
ncbi:SET domain-containing protein-lysine N-methyltransferase [Enterobacteriaceae bacterium LUAb1]